MLLERRRRQSPGRWDRRKEGATTPGVPVAQFALVDRVTLSGVAAHRASRSHPIAGANGQPSLLVVVVAAVDARGESASSRIKDGNVDLIQSFRVDHGSSVVKRASQSWESYADSLLGVGE